MLRMLKATITLRRSTFLGDCRDRPHYVHGHRHLTRPPPRVAQFLRGNSRPTAVYTRPRRPDAATTKRRPRFLESGLDPPRCVDWCGCSAQPSAGAAAYSPGGSCLTTLHALARMFDATKCTRRSTSLGKALDRPCGVHRSRRSMWTRPSPPHIPRGIQQPISRRTPPGIHDATSCARQPTSPGDVSTDHAS